MTGQTFNTSMLKAEVRRAMEDITRRLRVQEERILEEIDAGSVSDKAYADAQDAIHSAADRLYTDQQDAAHSVTDQAYADGVSAAAEVAAKSHADTEDDAHSFDDRAYTDTVDLANSLADQAYTDAVMLLHVDDVTDVHAASSIGFDGSLLSPVSKIWHPDTIDDVQQSNTTIIAEIDGRIEAGDTDAIIDAINGWTGGDSTITNEDVFEAGVIVTDALAAGAVVASKMAANSVEAAAIVAGSVDGSHISASSDIEIGSGATNWHIEGTADETTTVIRTSDATAYADPDGVWIGADSRVSFKDKFLFDGTDLAVGGAVTAEEFKVVDPISKTRRIEFGEANFDEGATESALIFYARDGDDDNMNISWVHGGVGQQTMTMGAEPLGASQHMAAGIKIQVTDDNSINRATLKGGRGDAQVSVNEGAAQMTYWNSTQSAPTYVLLNELSYSSRAESHTWFAGWDSVDPEMLNGDNAMMLMDDQARLWLNNRNAASDGRPWVSFANLNASGTSVRKGYIGYPENNSNTSGIYMIAETGNLQLSAAGGSLILTGAGNDIIQLASTAHFQWGSAAKPSIAFNGDTDTGMYRDGSDSISFATGGVQRLDVDGGGIKGKVSFSGPAGSVATPSFNFDGDTNTGMYRPANNEIGFSTAGALRALIGSGGFRVYQSGDTSDHLTLSVDASWGRIETTQAKFYFNKTISPLSVQNYTDGSETFPSFSFYNDQMTGMYRSNVSEVAISGGGSKMATFTGTNGVSINGPDRGTSATTWATAQLRIYSRTASGTAASNSMVSTSWWNQRYSIAPMIRSYGVDGEVMAFVNNSGSAYAPVKASAFTVSSTMRVKKHMEVMEDDRVIDLASKWLMAEFEDQTRPQQLRKTDRFKDVDRRWQARGGKPLEGSPERDYESMDHSCVGEDSRCHGTADNPCPISRNDTRRHGTIAEWWGEVAPEQTQFDEHGIASGVNVDQVASTALGAAGALSRRLQDALDRIDILEGKMPAPRAKGAWVQ